MDSERYQSPTSSITSSYSSFDQSGHYHVIQRQLIQQKYQVQKNIADGTFGRVVLATHEHKEFAIKVKLTHTIIKAVKRYISSAKQQKDCIEKIQKENIEGVVTLIEGFNHKQNYCLVFELLGKSLYQIIKLNNYKGYPAHYVQKIFRQSLQILSRLHQIGLTHTDLKPENICFVDRSLNLIKKKVSHSQQTKKYQYYLPHSTQVKIIDFGGATFDHEYHSTTINTRQYRAPEVILHCCKWFQASDIWSLGCIILEVVE